MKLSDYEFFPGSIIDVADPKYQGRVKANSPTLFDTSMDKEGLPWIYPFTMYGLQRFSKMTEGTKIWIIRNTQNYNEFWYIPMFELTQDSRDLINSDENYENGEILLSRSMGNMSVYIYYNDTDGIVIKYGDENFIKINPDSEVILQAGKGQMKISGNHVYLGDGEKGEPTVMGDKLKSLLSQLSTDLSSLGSTATPNPYTTALGPLFMQASTNISSALGGILAKNTNVD